MRQSNHKTTTEKRNEQVSRMLEPLSWRTTQREQEIGYEHRATAGKWALILSAIIRYQNRYDGSSPSNSYLCENTGLSFGEVRYHMGEMEGRGLLADDRAYPRHIQILDGAKRSPLAARTAVTEEDDKVKKAIVKDSATQDKAKANGRKTRTTFIDGARALAQAMIDITNETGQKPGPLQLAERCGYRYSGAVSYIVGKMLKLGWVSHRKYQHNDMTVTPKGLAALFSKENEEPEAPVASMTTPPPKMEVQEPMFFVTDEEKRKMYEGNDVPWSVDPGTTLSPSVNNGLAGANDLDLVLELNSRGYKVSR